MSLFIFLLVYPVIWLLSKLPFRVLYFISDGVYVLLYHIIGYRKKVVRFNLKTAFPMMDEASLKVKEKKFYHHFCDLFIEVIKTISISEKSLKKRYTFTNIEVLEAYYTKGQPVILTLGHYASYEWIFTLQLYFKKNPGYGIYKRIKNKYFDKMLRDIRGKWNSYLVPNKEAREKINEILSTQEGFTLFGFVMDQSPSNPRNKHFAPFFGVKTPFFTGVEQIAKQHDLPVIFIGTQKVKRGHYQSTFHVLADAPREHDDFAITDAYASMLAKQIAIAPEYYFWTHKRFKFLK